MSRFIWVLVRILRKLAAEQLAPRLRKRDPHDASLEEKRARGRVSYAWYTHRDRKSSQKEFLYEDEKIGNCIRRPYWRNDWQKSKINRRCNPVEEGISHPCRTVFSLATQATAATSNQKENSTTLRHGQPNWDSERHPRR